MEYNNDPYFRLIYDKYTGGVLEMKGTHYKMINGFSNVYFGWGAEDDDLYGR